MSDYDRPSESEPLGDARRRYDSLNAQEQEDLLCYAIRERKSREKKLRDIVMPGTEASPFDLDLIDGQAGEMAFLNIATSGKHEVKRDFAVSDTGNVAVEIMCRGKPSCLSTTTAPYWVYWLSGSEYQDEVAVVITVKRLRRIVETCRLLWGGDGKQSRLRIVPVRKLLLSNAQIEGAAVIGQPDIFDWL